MRLNLLVYDEPVEALPQAEAMRAGIT